MSNTPARTSRLCDCASAGCGNAWGVALSATNNSEIFTFMFVADQVSEVGRFRGDEVLRVVAGRRETCSKGVCFCIQIPSKQS